MIKKDDYESDFYLAAIMAGIKQIKGNKFSFDGRVYTVSANVSSEVSASFGGTHRAFRLLRFAQMIEHACSTPGNNHLFGVVAKSFDRVSRQYPVLRSYYEAARVGGFKHTSVRWAA